MKLRNILTIVLLLCAPPAFADSFFQGVPSSLLSPSGPAGGDLGGTYPDPTVVYRPQIVAAGCNAGTPSTGLDLPDASPVFPVCLGTAGFGALEYPDAATNGAQFRLELPATWSGSFGLSLVYTGDTSSTNTIDWRVSTGCVGASESLASVSFNATVTESAAGPATAGQRKTIAFDPAPAVTNCAAGETLIGLVEVLGAADAYVGKAQLVSVVPTL